MFSAFMLCVIVCHVHFLVTYFLQQKKYVGIAGLGVIIKVLPTHPAGCCAGNY